MSYPKLRGKIREVYGGQAEFARAMGKDPSTISAKLSKKTDWTRGEIELACSLLGIPMADIGAYFFN